MERSNQAGARHRPLEPMKGSNQASAGHGPGARWKSQNVLAHVEPPIANAAKLIAQRPRPYGLVVDKTRVQCGESGIVTQPLPFGFFVMPLAEPAKKRWLHAVQPRAILPPFRHTKTILPPNVSCTSHRARGCPRSE